MQLTNPELAVLSCLKANGPQSLAQIMLTTRLAANEILPAYDNLVDMELLSVSNGNGSRFIYDLTAKGKRALTETINQL